MSEQIRSERSGLPPAIFLMGPTASGKTDLAIQLCKKLPCEIISVDSALIYREMDIGTAKPSLQELVETPHRLVDIIDPSQTYSAAQFRKDALVAMKEISDRGNIPLLVGGTMLYFKALQEGLADIPSSDLAIRKQIELQANEHGWPYMHAQLEAVDPESARRIHPRHSQRIERALGVYLSTGTTMTEFYKRQQQQRQKAHSLSPLLPYRIMSMAIAPVDRKVLHNRIQQRFHSMLEQGLLAEVQALHGRPDLSIDLPSMRAVGYRQVWLYLEGELSLDEMIERGIIATRQLAKRQFTWLNNWADLHWLHTDAKGLLVSSDQTAVDVEGLEGAEAVALALKYFDKFSA